MSAYDPPIQNLPIFDVDYFFPDESNPITLFEAEKLFVKKSNAIVNGSLSVGGTTTLFGTLSIPSYPDVSTELTSIETRLTGITYTLPTDTTHVDNSLNVVGTLYLTLPSTTPNTYADVVYDITNKTMYYKEPVYGQFSSTQNQVISATTTPTLFTYDTTTNALNCSIQTTTSQIKVLVQGLYRFAISPNIEGNGSHQITFWFVKNGTAIPNSASQITISSGKSLPFVEIFETMNVNDVIEVAAIANSSGQQITAVPATSPAPAIPSIILIVQRIN